MLNSTNGPSSIYKMHPFVINTNPYFCEVILQIESFIFLFLTSQAWFDKKPQVS